MQEGAPKSAAGVRNIALPDFLVEELRTHLVTEGYSGPGPDGRVFQGEKGGMLRRSNFSRSAKWPDVVVKAGLPSGFHFHDLRHTGNQLAATTGATTRELMHGMGHGSMRAALIYQHASAERDRQIADTPSRLVADSMTPLPEGQHDDGEDDDGSAGRLVPVA